MFHDDKPARPRANTRRERDDARAVVELDHADLDVFAEAGGTAMFVETVHREVLLAAAGDRAGEVEDLDVRRWWKTRVGRLVRN